MWQLNGKRDALKILSFKIDMKAINDEACQDCPNSTHQMFYNTFDQHRIDSDKILNFDTALERIRQLY